MLIFRYYYTAIAQLLFCVYVLYPVKINTQVLKSSSYLMES